MWQKILEGFIELYANDGECSPVVRFPNRRLCSDDDDVIAHIRRFHYLVSGLHIDSDKRWVEIEKVGQEVLNDGYTLWGQFPKCDAAAAGLIPNVIFYSGYPPDWTEFRRLARSATCNLTEEDYARAAIPGQDGGDIQHWLAWLFYCCRGYRHHWTCAEAQCIKTPVQASIWAVRKIIETSGVGTPETPPDPLAAFVAVCLRQRDALVGAVAVDAQRDRGEPEEIDQSGNVVSEGRPPAPARTADLMPKAWELFEDSFRRIETTIEDRYLPALREAQESHRLLLNEASERWQTFSGDLEQERHIEVFEELRRIRKERQVTQSQRATTQATPTKTRGEVADAPAITARQVSPPTNLPTPRGPSNQCKYESLIKRVENHVREHGFTSRNKLAKKFKCARATMDRIIHESEPLSREAKIRKTRKGSSVAAQQMNPVVLATARQTQNPDPRDVSESVEDSPAWNRLIDEASPSDRATYFTMSEARKRELVDAMNHEPD